MNSHNTSRCTMYKYMQNGYMTCSGTQSCSCFNVALQTSVQFNTYKMIPFPALITVDPFVSTITQAAHTINLEAG